MASKKDPISEGGDTPPNVASVDTSEASTPAVRISALRDGFRRAGVAHTKEPVDWPAGRWTTDELTALEAEPELVVVRISE